MLLTCPETISDILSNPILMNAYHGELLLMLEGDLELGYETERYKPRRSLKSTKFDVRKENQTESYANLPAMSYVRNQYKNRVNIGNCPG